MKWFRRHLGAGSRLALFALTLQFVLSFGHFHADAGHATAAVQTMTDPAHAQGSAPGAASETPQGNQDTDQPPNEPCATCAAVSMAHQMVFAPAIALFVPDTIGPLFPAIADEFAHLGSPRSAFQSRAPPAS